jgi:hypothetical protein
VQVCHATPGKTDARGLLANWFDANRARIAWYTPGRRDIAAALRQSRAMTGDVRHAADHQELGALHLVVSPL